VLVLLDNLSVGVDEPILAHAVGSVIAEFDAMIAVLGGLGKHWRQRDRARSLIARTNTGKPRSKRPSAFHPEMVKNPRGGLELWRARRGAPTRRSFPRGFSPPPRDSRRDRLVARALPGPKTPPRKRHRYY